MKFERYKKAAKSDPTHEHGIFLAAKLLMLAVYLWSGFFWGGATIYNFYFLTKTETHLATMLLIGSSCLLLSLILSFAKKYIFQMPFALAGTVLYCVVAAEMMAVAKKTAVVFTVAFEYRYLPAILFGVLSLALFGYKAYTLIMAKKNAQEEYDNLPSKSILD